MEIEGCQEIHLDPEARGRTADNLFPENQADLTTSDLSETLDAQNKVDLGTEDHDLLPELHKSREAGQTRTKGKYNLRKSLAWDSAFFTSAGVLDAEELSSMITGGDTGKKQFLPGIQEDITASTESISSLENDNLNLETLEEELFIDIRASIQRSNKKVPNLTNLSDKKANLEVDSTSISSLKYEGVTSSSQDKNPTPGSRRTTGVETFMMSKSLAKQNVWKHGSKKVIKQESGQSQVTSVAKIVEKNPRFSKIPKAISKTISTSATIKRDSTGIGRGKSECGSSKLGAPATTSKGTQPPKVSVGAGRMLPRPAVSSNPSLLNSSTTGRVQSMRSSTSSDRFCGSSGAPPKSLARRRNPGKSNIAVAGPGSIPKTQSRLAVRNKPSSSTSSPHLTSKLSSSVSPASSISDWSSVSSSTSSMLIRKFNNSRTSIDTSSSVSVDGDTVLLPSRSLSADETSGGPENRKVNISNSILCKTPTTGAVQASTKPTGLRMPSPKIGFFDGVKSSPRTPAGHTPSQPGLRTAIPKNVAAASSPNCISNGKLKGVKAPSTRMSTSLSSLKPDSTKVTSIASAQEKSHASINSYSVSLDVKGFSSLSHGVKGNEHGEECQKAAKDQVNSRVKQAVDEGTDAIVKENLGDLNKDDSMVPTDIHGMHTVSPQNEAAASSPSQISSGKLKGMKSPTTRMSPSLPSWKPNSPNVTSLSSSHEESHDSIKSSSVSWDVKGSPSLFLGVEGNEPEEECQKAEKVKVDDEVKQVVDADMDAIVKGNLGVLNRNEFMVPEDILGMSTMPPKHEASSNSPSQTSNSKVKGIRSPTTGMPPSLASSKFDPPKVASPASFKEKSHATINSFSVSLDVKDSPSLFIGVKGNQPEECEMAEKLQVDDGVKQVVVDAGTDAIVKGKGNWILNDFMVPEDIQGMCSLLSKNEATDTGPSQNTNGKLKGVESLMNRMSPSLARSKPDSLTVISLTFSQELPQISLSSSSVSLDAKDFSCLALGVEGNDLGEECRKAEQVQVENGVKQMVGAGTDATVKGNISELNINNDDIVPEDYKASVETNEVEGFECVGQKNMQPDENGPEKENGHDRYQVEGIIGCKNVCGPKNELSCVMGCSCCR